MSFILAVWKFVTGGAASAWGVIGAIITVVLSLLAIYFGIKKSGSDAQKVKDNEVADRSEQEINVRIDDAQNTADRTRIDSSTNPDRVRIKRPNDPYDRG